MSFKKATVEYDTAQNCLADMANYFDVSGLPSDPSYNVVSTPNGLNHCYFINQTTVSLLLEMGFDITQLQGTVIVLDPPVHSWWGHEYAPIVIDNNGALQYPEPPIDPE